MDTKPRFAFSFESEAQLIEQVNQHLSAVKGYANKYGETPTLIFNSDEYDRVMDYQAFDPSTCTYSGIHIRVDSSSPGSYIESP